MVLNRRKFIQSMLSGLAGFAAGTGLRSSAAGAISPVPAKSRVAFAAGSDRRDLIAQVLQPFEKEIKAGIKGKQVVIKPNCV